MLSKRESKYFKSLQLKKYRQIEGKFLVEGAKGIEEVLASDLEVDVLIGISEFLDSLNTQQLSKVKRVIPAKEADLTQIGTFKSNKAGIAIITMPAQKAIEEIKDSLVLVLDGVNDPGNLGTIVRIADWYGIQSIVCSPDTADIYNPKVINSTMGSFTRVDVLYTDLKVFLSNTQRKVFGALLEGESIYKSTLGDGIILMGSESHGISDELRPFISDPIKIPGHGKAESLNVAVATAIILDNFFRL